MCTLEYATTDETRCDNITLPSTMRTLDRLLAVVLLVATSVQSKIKTLDGSMRVGVYVDDGASTDDIGR